MGTGVPPGYGSQNAIHWTTQFVPPSHASPAGASVAPTMHSPGNFQYAANTAPLGPLLGMRGSGPPGAAPATSPDARVCDRPFLLNAPTVPMVIAPRVLRFSYTVPAAPPDPRVMKLC